MSEIALNCGVEDGSLVSIQRGRVITEGDPECRDSDRRPWTSAFRKAPIDGPVRISVAGVDGDEFGNPAAHGGVDKAVLFYAIDHYSNWRSEYPHLPWGESPGGGFGENLTVSGIDEANVCIGDRFQIGDVIAEISQPRQPCWKINRRWGDRTLLKRVSQTGRTGWYARIVTEGTISVDDRVRRLGGPNPGWTISKANDILMKRESDHMAKIELMSLPELAQAWKEAIA